ncbi:MULTISPECIES: glycosyltransferase [Rhodococcus]|uniref:MGT family glycosyltransferase n=1 Tax=Rhodococcus rhodochrous J45 TaxID=935266 RepID=A0A562E0L4_RHORH|nr:MULTISPECIES: glycosyltransferase [Rhodococcus]MCR8695277.1 glycosyltransferase [Rhodococcus pyridinivorans]TWH15522.1 MGT family glycosyltransferase [Rhodococcus rhodochrous J45]UPK64369.1 glycosyltransferase [Rhodococcus pyridinivorans]
MARYLLCATPAGGHVTPILAVASALGDRGHEVTVLTGSRFRSFVESCGIAFRELTGAADIDDRDPDSFLPDRHHYKGLRLAQYQLRRMFIDPIPAQYRDVAAAVDDVGAEAVVVDAMFLGALPILESPVRGAVVALGVSPLSLPSSDVPPYNSGLVPMRGSAGRLRNKVLNGVIERAFDGLDRHADHVLRAITDRGLPGGLFGAARMYDRYLQLGPAEFEYSRHDLPPNVRFVGPLGMDGSVKSYELPRWWPELEGRRVVHVTQGTAANFDLGTLIRPTIDALGDTDLAVVVATGGAPIHDLGPLPTNVFAAEFIPHAELFRHTDAFVTNGGYGAVTTALAHGVPIVVAPGGEDKREVAAHIRHFGVGVDLRRARPTPRRIAAAVRQVLENPRYRTAAGSMAVACRKYRPHDLIESELEAATAEVRSRKSS